MAAEEVRAREVLRALEDRLVHGPAAALGVSANANPTEIRHAFFELTKTYHPQKFARFAVDIQRQSNEVFLALRAAHDVLAKAARQMSQQRPSAPSLPTGTASTIRQTGQLPVTPANNGTARSTGAVPPVPRPGVAPRPTESSQALPRRNGTPAGGVKVVKPATPTTPTTPTTTRPSGAHAVIKTDDEMAAVVDLLTKQRWDEARSALHGLAAKAPSDPKIRALLAYTHGREAQLRGDVDEARVELMNALNLDGELQLAKTALGELFARRK